MRILLVEDDAKAARVLARGLQEEGYVIDVGGSGEVGRELARLNAYDVMILDWMLPGREGIEVCREMRAAGVVTPVLMLSARATLEDRVRGLDSGADDYLTKPFAFSELLARLRAILRRPPAVRSPVLEVGDLSLDPATHRVTRAGQRITVTAREFAILEVLMRNAGDLVTRRRLVESVWDGDPGDLANLLDVHVSHLRRKIDGTYEPRLLHTVRGRGFLLGLHP